MQRGTELAALPYRLPAGSLLPYALVGVAVLGIVYAVGGKAWKEAVSLAISVVFILGVLGLAALLKRMNDRMAIIATPDAFQLRGLFNDVRTLASRAAVTEIVLTGGDLLLMDANGRELFRTERNAWSDQQIQGFGQAVSVPVRHA